MMTPVKSCKKIILGGNGSTVPSVPLGGECFKFDNPATAVNHLNQVVVHDSVCVSVWKLLGRTLVESGWPADASGAYCVGIAVAEAKGAKQAAKVMTTYARRIAKASRENKKRVMKTIAAFRAWKGFLMRRDSTEIFLIGANLETARAQRWLVIRNLRDRDAR